jgi:hypothetical protein
MSRINKTPQSIIQKVNPKEWEQLKDDAEAAREILEDPKFQFFRDYLETAKKSIIDYFVQNRIRPVEDTVKTPKGGEKTLITTKQEQLDELSGQYKFIENMVLDLQAVVNAPKETSEAAARGAVELPTSEEETTKEG